MHFHKTKQKQTPKTLGILDFGSRNRQLGQNSDSTVDILMSALDQYLALIKISTVLQYYHCFD